MENDRTTAASRCADDAFFTSELARRPPRAPDHEAENRALGALARELDINPRGVPQKLAELVIELCRADSAGISILEPGGKNGMFRWRAAAGLFAANLDGTIPREESPCGMVISRNSTLLFKQPEQHFPALLGMEPRIHEALLVPWTMNGNAVGAVWAVGHRPDRRFDAEDARLLQSLASFASAAFQMSAALDETRSARQESERHMQERIRLLSESNERLEQEIERRRMVEAALRESEERFRRAVQARNVGVIFFDTEGAVTDANDAFLEMSGYDRDDLAAGRLRWDRMTPPEWMADSLRAIEEFKSRGYTTPYEKEYIRKDGTRWWALFAGTCITENEGVEYVIDITGQKHAGQALRESEARFRALTDASPALIWQLDASGNIAYLNQRYLDVTGFTPEQLQAAGWDSIVHPDDLPDYLEARDRARREHVRLQRRVRLKTREHEWHWFESYAAPWFAPNGEYRGHVGISIDVTEAVQAEETLKEADRRKDEFLATLAHELRNPLAPISNAVHLLRRPDGRRSADRIVEMVGRQVDHIVRLVDDLLEISRITRGKIELSKDPVLLDDIVAGAVEISRPVIDHGRHRLIVSLPDEPLIFEADKVRMTQVLANLLTNAAKYTDTGGTIRVSGRREGGDAVLSVRDNGIGIPKDQLPHVFNMFTQIHRSVGRGHGGLGIGLTMVRSLVHLHGGEVAAHSAGPGQGSEFIVRLPLADMDVGEPAETASAAACASAPLFGQRILVVDDNRDAADSLGLLLEADGAVADIVYDGHEALAAVERSQPHTVLLDIGMPGMNGYDVAQAIRRNRRCDGIRLIALTGWGQPADRLRSQSCGLDHHLTKPVDYPALRNLLTAEAGKR